MDDRTDGYCTVVWRMGAWLTVTYLLPHDDSFRAVHRRAGKPSKLSSSAPNAKAPLETHACTLNSVLM